VLATQDAVPAAERFRVIECERRGPLCRQRETEETAARSAMATAAAGYATTERAIQLDAELTIVRQKLERAPAVAAVNPQAALIARVLHMPDVSAAATAQHLAVAVVVELLIVGALMAFEMLGRAQAAASMGQDTTTEAEVVVDVVDPAAAAPGPAVVARVPERVAPPVIERVTEPVRPPAPRPAPAPMEARPVDPDAPKPKNRAQISRAVAALLTDLLEPAPRSRVTLEQVYRGYLDACRQRGLEPVEPNDFLDPLQQFCRVCSIQTSATSAAVYLHNVALAAAPATQPATAQVA
jgi:hypothetical protein